MKLYELSACQILAKIRNKEVTVVEVATAFIERIKTVNPAINAIHQFDPARILQEAQQKDQEIAQGKQLGKLHGLPISIKDGQFTPGFHCAKGSKKLYETMPTDKAAVIISRLLKEGVIILGITNVPEFLAAYESDNLINGRTNNPYDLARTPGGSSGGEAALIAAGGSCVGIGGDAGGSIRVPAHYTGIAGIKPTKGLVPTTGSIPSDTGSMHLPLATLGPMARTVEDLELILSVIAGADDGDPLSVSMPLRHSDEVDVAKLNVIYFSNNGVIAADKDTELAFNNAISKLKNSVASIKEVNPPEILKETNKLLWDTCFLGGNEGKVFDKFFAAIGQTEFSPLFQNHLRKIRQSSFDNTEFHNRIAQIHAYKQAMLKLIQDADILLTPVTATPARLHGTTQAHLEEFTYAQTFNLTGWPAASINCGFSKEGLPIGIQIAAKPWNDHMVLAFAKQAQKVLGIPKVVNP